MRQRIEGGKQCTRLALTWNDRISFVLTESLSLKKITLLDVLKENSDVAGKNNDERIDGDFMLFTGEVNKLLGDLVVALGGPLPSNIESDEQSPSTEQPAPAASPAVQPISEGDWNSPDELYDQAVKIVLTQKRASVSLVQRHLRIGYNRAARLLEQMENNGVVSVMQSNGNRNILVAA